MNRPDDALSDALKNSFGLDYLYPYQRLVAANVIDSAAAEGGSPFARSSSSPPASASRFVSSCPPSSFPARP